jgi:hypothetical protein
MEENQIAHLKAEIVRQDKIIEALLFANEQMRLQIAHLNIANASGDVPFAYENIYKGKGEVPLAFRKVENGTGELPVAIPNFQNGNIEIPVADVNFNNGNAEIPLAILKKYIGKGEIADDVPKSIELNDTNIFKLKNYLTQTYRIKTSPKTMGRAAKLLLHFYNNLPGDYPTLMRLTGHSNFGLAKFIRSLKKRHWIVAAGHQKFALTESARKMVAGVFAEK